eukprot:366534-Chlamydomonas_euryale.AAC.4
MAVVDPLQEEWRGSASKGYRQASRLPSASFAARSSLLLARATHCAQQYKMSMTRSADSLSGIGS